MYGFFSTLNYLSFTAIVKTFHTTTCENLLLAAYLVDTCLQPASQLCILQNALLLPSPVNWNVLNFFDEATSEDVCSSFSRVPLVVKLVELNVRELL